PLWTNARGAIARFDRGAIEIRVLDVQETPTADVAILAFVVELAKALVQESCSTQRAQRELEARRLDAIFRRTTRDGMAARVDDAAYLNALGLDAAARDARTVLAELYARLPVPASQRGPIELILEEGNLSERLLARAGARPSAEALRELYAELATLLPEGRQLRRRP